VRSDALGASRARLLAAVVGRKADSVITQAMSV